MASTTSLSAASSEDSGGDLLKDGFLFVKDADTGQRVEEMETSSTPFASERGLEFYRINVLDDPVCTMIPLVRSIKTDFALA
jgi:hypothetical protein